MLQYKGIGLSPGIAVGNIYLYSRIANVPEQKRGLGLKSEADRFHSARERISNHLLELHTQARKEARADEAAIFHAHSRIALDRVLERETLALIESFDICAEWALYNASQKIADRLSSTDDPVIRGRVDDIRDVSDRIIRLLMGVESTPIKINADSIIVADELLPSDIALFSEEKTKGFITEKGSFTSHVAIIARSFETPAVAGIKNITLQVRQGDCRIIDGTTGEIIISPDEVHLTRFKQWEAEYKRHKEELAIYRSCDTITSDGKRFLVEANIGSMAYLDAALANGCEGVGLLRTEFLFMQNKRIPTEDEQYSFYHTIAVKLQGRPLVIRTLDIGGDKQIEYLHIEKEENPFLGMRAIRYSLRYRELFISQIRAILRAGCCGNVNLMIPMITSLDELLSAKKIIRDALQSLTEKKWNMRKFL
jgi:phosphotransferase system enzyme I (PtsI)